MKAWPALGRPRSAAWRGCLLLTVAALPLNAVSRASPILWSLKRPAPSPDGLARWDMAAPAPAVSGAQPMLPDPTIESAAGDLPSPSQDFSIAPSVDNILNRRHDLSEDQAGAPGSSSSYIRSVGRTFGLALKRALY